MKIYRFNVFVSDGEFDNLVTGYTLADSEEQAGLNVKESFPNCENMTLYETKVIIGMRCY